MSDKTTCLPGAAELIEAVAEFLEDRLLPEFQNAEDSSRRFNTRVSINALRIVQRELAQETDASLTADLQTLVGDTPGGPESLLLQLAERIREGEFDDGDRVLLAALRKYAINRLAVDNPKYSSYLAAVGKDDKSAD